ncbi:hypothetical protein [Thermoproteus tenax]|uniref:Uncharacterized protein n=1 Tax=Thermoproteus tenax (strain ATCC 35583 / DSM 2078 / JCM 9277 / NBRC 100435 / Kra 1) TaxID=768679 RepID=G4RPW4_THETK|nr:hypothetical protein [Thermoproteus tenax]CCC81609.1 hypothetical protein TTX_0960 [Thermoproteus tenax Kra 1]
MEHISLLRLVDVVHALFAMEREPYAYEAFIRAANSWALRALSNAPGRDLRAKACNALGQSLGKLISQLRAPSVLKIPCSIRQALNIDRIKYTGCPKFLAEWGAEYVYRLVYDERLRRLAIKSAMRNLSLYAHKGLRVEGAHASEWLAEDAVSATGSVEWKPYLKRLLSDILPLCQEVGALLELEG